MRQEQAQGILVAALGMLAAHFGYVEAKRGLLKDACATLDDRFWIEEQRSQGVTATAARDPPGLGCSRCRNAQPALAPDPIMSSTSV